MEAGIQQRLVADTTVSGLLATRVYPVILPDDPALPAVTYQRISTPRITAIDGPIQLVGIRLQIDAWARTYAQVKSLDTAIRASLEGFSGTLPDGTAVDNIRLDDAHDGFDSVARLFRVSADYIVFAFE